ncbi:MAG: cell wall hydrolase [Caulobacteraceae bacterium]|nr:cell wall hydrolase [Caulobacteraceae bacterium]
MKFPFAALAAPRALIGAAIAVGALSAGAAAYTVFDRPAPQPARLHLANAPAPAPVPVTAAQPVKVEPPARLHLASVRAAPAFDARSATRRDLECLTAAVYYEARGESAAGQAAVAQVILNRVHDPRFPKSVCSVVYQGAGGRGCQFSFACDGVLDRAGGGAAWDRARRVAARALSGFVMAEVGNATHFHATRVSPGWGSGLRQVAQIGLHVFYRPARGGAPYVAPVKRQLDPVDQPEAIELASLTTAPPAPVVLEPVVTPAAEAAPAVTDALKPEVSAPAAKPAASVKPTMAVKPSAKPAVPADASVSAVVGAST